MLPRLSSSEIARVITPGRDNNERNERGRERERERERGKTREFIIWGSGGSRQRTISPRKGEREGQCPTGRVRRLRTEFSWWNKNLDQWYEREGGRKLVEIRRTIDRKLLAKEEEKKKEKK